ncbi:MAG: carbohydrate-binding family 9-like protein [Phycisphaerales bacterium]|nr:carbohydrate-binding family 9-like protein [Phycisphaerales bacterium]
MIAMLELFLMPMPRTYICQYVETPPVIDGRANDWSGLPWTEEFIDIEGTDVPPLRTRAKMCWDDEAIYFMAEMVEPHLWATYTERDSVIFHENDFEVFLNPSGDSHTYYEFEMNALNTVWDLLLRRPYKDGGSADNDWTIKGLRTAVHLDGTLNDPSDVDRGWTVEIAMPFKAFDIHTDTPGAPNPGDQWRINFSRVEWDLEVVDGVYRKIKDRPEHNWVWSPQYVINMHKPEHWGYVQFSKGQHDTFIPDESRPARVTLQKIYEAQRLHHKAHDSWATTFAELGLDPGRDLATPTAIGDPRLHAGDPWHASVRIRTSKGEQEWTITHDARVFRSK